MNICTHDRYIYVCRRRFLALLFQIGLESMLLDLSQVCFGVFPGKFGGRMSCDFGGRILIKISKTQKYA